MAVVDGVAQVALLSLMALQDGDTYSALLGIAHKLHGGCCSCLFSPLLVLHYFLIHMKLVSDFSVSFLSSSCFGVTARLRGTSAAPHPRSV